MNKSIKYSRRIISILLFVFLISSCKDFFDPKEELNITESQLYDDWYEYRSVEIGLYGLQQKLVEQLLILGELRGDLLQITPNADADMVEVYNFNVLKTNKYASPTNFFKLISACNNFIKILKEKHPEVLDPNQAVTNYDKLYGEALCMRAWAYFNAARIYGKVPYIHESLTTIEEIENYVNSPGTYIDSVYINFSADGYYNDTIHNQPITLEKHMYDLPLVLDVFTNQLEKEVKAVGVDHAIDNNDATWEVTTWNKWAMYALLGHMYLTQGNLAKARDYFERIMRISSENYRYQLDQSFSFSDWYTIFNNIDNKEHIYTIWFNKTNFQQNEFQTFFEPWTPNKFMLKPTHIAIDKWETVYRSQVVGTEDLANPSKTKMTSTGIPSDFYRGYGSSYLYVKEGGIDNYLDGNDYMNMLFLRMNGDIRSSKSILDGYDTIVLKYSIKNSADRYAHDANFIIYRAASIHLYMAEIYNYQTFIQPQSGLVSTARLLAEYILNDGSYFDVAVNRKQLGVRGRVGLGSGYDAVVVKNIVYLHDPYTNKIIGYRDLTGNLKAKQEYFEEQLLEERARELAYEGERFYDLMRIAKRRNDPSFLAKIVSAKYPSGQREAIYNYLLDENNWYIKYFEQ